VTEKTLFPLPDREPKQSNVDRRAGLARRVLTPERRQMRLLPTSLDALLPDDRKARAVWAYVDRLDLSKLYACIQSVEGDAGRPAVDPRILLGLWLYATIDGVGSARALARLCEVHSAYRWICGGVHANHVTLSLFRRSHASVLDDLFTQSVALLRHEGLVDLKRIAQDGMRVRANAGAASFRRRKSLEKCLEEAKAQVERLAQELDEDPGATSKRQQAAKKRAVRERAERVQRALDQLPDVQAAKERSAKKADREKAREAARVSTTDPDARVMKMADGGFRPAMNVQFAVDTASQVVVGVDVTNRGSDLGELPPMLDQIAERHGTRPEEILVDGGFVKLKDFETVSREPYNCTVYAPVQKPRDASRDPHEPRPTDGPAAQEWRRRMGTDGPRRSTNNAEPRWSA
jgi:transposase